MIQITEEPYDGEVATRLLLALGIELNERYADEDDFTAEDAAAEDARYRAEVRPEEVAAPQGTFVVAWLDGQPAGCGALKGTGQPGVGEIKRMYVTPAARRQGVSRQVLHRLEAAAEQLGYHRLILETGTAQPEAIALYESAGWQRMEPYGRWKHSPSSVCFTKDLPAPT